MIKEENRSGSVVGLTAHVDAGKTTLTEALLFACGNTRSAGSVDSGTTHTDTLEIERRRAISVRTATVSLNTPDGTVVTLVDTPGHADFSAEVDRSLRIMDAAVLIVPAVEGIEARTYALWDALKRAALPTVFFINKIDRAGSDSAAVVKNIENEFGISLLGLNRVVSEGSRAASVTTFSADAPELAEAAAAEDEALLETYLNGETLNSSDVIKGLKKGIALRDIFPAVFGSGALGLGVDTLIECMSKLLPVFSAPDSSPLAGEVFRVTHDKTYGRLAHIRLYGGTLSARESPQLRSPGETDPTGGLLPPDGEESQVIRQRVPLKITRICRSEGDRLRDISIVRPGEVAVLAGLSDAKPGDIFGAMQERNERFGITEPLLSVGVSPMSPELLAALRELEAEDPTLKLLYTPEDGSLSVSVTGQLELEVLDAILQSRFGLHAGFSAPTVIYKETPASVAIGHEAYTMPKPCWAVLDLKVEPLPRGSGYRFSSTVPYKNLFYKYQTHIAAELPHALQQGIYNWQVIDLAVTLVGGQHHTIHTHPLDFFLATPLALIHALENSGTVLLEPMRDWRVTADASLGSRIIGDILRMGGTAEPPVYTGSLVRLEARVPVASSLDYPIRLAAMSGGKAVLSQTFSGYEPTAVTPEKIAKRRGCDPRDRAKWILTHRGAMTDSRLGAY